jgi:hypothetical protein
MGSCCDVFDKSISEGCEHLEAKISKLNTWKICVFWHGLHFPVLYYTVRVIKKV